MPRPGSTATTRARCSPPWPTPSGRAGGSTSATGGAAKGVRRRVDPLGLVLKAGTWYLVAAHRRRPRTWRVSRITPATPRPEPAWRPPGFDLARWWSASAAAFDASIRPLRARLRLSPAAARRLPRLVPGELTVRALEQGEVDAE